MRMPRYALASFITNRPHLTRGLARLHMRNVHTVSLIASAHNIAAVEAEADTAHRARHIGQSVLRHPVQSIPDDSKRVAAACRDVGAGGRHRDALAGSGMAAKGV